jgi:cytochrome oxidase Cu insertion factor (SCO1/SenC/PrrC family)
MKKIETLSILGGLVSGLLALSLSTQLTQAETLSKAFEDFKILEFKEKPQAPEFQLKDLSGNLVNLKDYKDKVLMLVFWATW